MSGLEMKYFILKPKSKTKDDPYALASRRALRAYAGVIRDTNTELAKSLNDWADNEAFKGARLDETNV